MTNKKCAVVINNTLKIGLRDSKYYSKSFVKFNSKFNNTSKAETGNFATPSKSGSFYTTLTHIHTHTHTHKIPTKEMVAHYERVITHYL